MLLDYKARIYAQISIFILIVGVKSVANCTVTFNFSWALVLVVERPPHYIW